MVRDRIDTIGAAVRAVLVVLTASAVVTVTGAVFAGFAFILVDEIGFSAGFVGDTTVSIVAGTTVAASATIAALSNRTTRMSWDTRLRMVLSLLVIAVLSAFATGLAFVPITLVSQYVVDSILPGAALSVLIATGLTIVTVLGVRDAGPETNWELTLRMAISCLLLVVLTVWFLVFVWIGMSITVTIVLLTALGPVSLIMGSTIPTVVTGIVLVTAAYGELNRVRTIERYADATPISEAEHPELYALTTAVAAQLDVPVPTIAVSNTQLPEALAVGYHPERIHLILSAGTIDALDDDELGAVIAHELAHVANRDAMVMTAISLPIMFAEKLRVRIVGYGRSNDLRGTTPSGSASTGASPASQSTAGDDRERSSAVGIAIGVPVLLVAIPTHVLGRMSIAVLTRARETAADQAAVEVTGSPETLASALQRLDRRIDETPDRDLRAAVGISSLSILPVDPDHPHPKRVTEPDEPPPLFWTIRRPIWWLRWRLFVTHPSTERRIETLTDRADQTNR